MKQIYIDEQVIKKLNEFKNPFVTKAALGVIIKKIEHSNSIKELGTKPGGELYGAEAIGYGRFLFICFEKVIDQRETIITITDVVIS